MRARGFRETSTLLTRISCGALVLAAAAGLSIGAIGVASADQAGTVTCAEKLALSLSSEFPSVLIDAAARPDSPYPDHSQGRAIDVLIDNYSDQHQIDLGNQIVARLHELSLAGEYPVAYTLFRQSYAEPGQPAVPMEDRGDPVQNHLNHVHASLDEFLC